MKNIIFLFLASLILSCGNTGPDEGSIYPIQVGTWLVQSEDNADWIGQLSSANRAKIDTTITEPGDFQMSVSKDTISGHNLFWITFIDSSANANETGINISDTEITLPSTFGYAGRSISGHLYLRMTLDYACKDPINNDEEITVDLYTDEGIYKTYHIPTTGLKEVVRHIVCGDELTP